MKRWPSRWWLRRSWEHAETGTCVSRRVPVWLTATAPTLRRPMSWVGASRRSFGAKTGSAREHVERPASQLTRRSACAGKDLCATIPRRVFRTPRTAPGCRSVARRTTSAPSTAQVLVPGRVMLASARFLDFRSYASGGSVFACGERAVSGTGDRLAACHRVGSHEDGTLVSQEHSPRGVHRMTLLSVVGRASSVQGEVWGRSEGPARPWA